MRGRLLPRFRKLRTGFFGQGRSLQGEFSSFCSPSALYQEGLGSGLRLATGYMRGFQAWQFSPPPTPSGAVVTTALPGQPRESCCLQPSALRLPAKLYPVWPAGHQAV